MADDNVIIPVPLSTYRLMVNMIAGAVHPNHTYNEVNQAVQGMVKLLPENMHLNKDPNAS